MRAVVQRVQNATVTVDGLVISAIGNGLLAWFAFGAHDGPQDLDYMVNTLLTTKFFHSERRRWTRSIVDAGYEILALSQISLYSTVHMKRPCFYDTMDARRSKSFYERLLKSLRLYYKPDKIREGRFGSAYTVTSQTRGPVFMLESSIQYPQQYPLPMAPPPNYPPQHYPQVPMYEPPQPQPQIQPVLSRDRKYLKRFRQPLSYQYPKHSPFNQTYQGLPPLRPLQPDYVYY